MSFADQSSHSSAISLNRPVVASYLEFYLGNAFLVSRNVKTVRDSARRHCSSFPRPCLKPRRPHFLIETVGNCAASAPINKMAAPTKKIEEWSVDTHSMTLVILNHLRMCVAPGKLVDCLAFNNYINTYYIMCPLKYRQVFALVQRVGD